MVAVVRLINKLKNQSEFTQMAYLGGENGGGISTREVVALGPDPFAVARSC
jgi:hypothetical protein